MLKIFPLREAVDMLDARYLDYLAAGGPPFHHLRYQLDSGEIVTIDQPPKPLEWRALVYASLDDAINQTLAWTSPTQKEGECLARMFPQFVTEGPCPAKLHRARLLTERRITELQQRLDSLQVALRQEPSLPPEGTFIREEIRFVETDGDPFQPQLVMEPRYLDPRGRALRQRDQTRQRLAQEITSTQRQLEGARARLQHMPTVNDAYLEQCEKFHQDILVPMWDHITEWLEETLGAEEDSQWRIWVLRELGEDLAIESGKDYRVFDWERRMRSGEWEREEASHPFHG